MCAMVFLAVCKTDRVHVMAEGSYLKLEFSNELQKQSRYIQCKYLSFIKANCAAWKPTSEFFIGNHAVEQSSPFRQRQIYLDSEFIEDPACIRAPAVRAIKSLWNNCAYACA